MIRPRLLAGYLLSYNIILFNLTPKRFLIFFG
jgi:hypothetical protein